MKDNEQRALHHMKYAGLLQLEMEGGTIASELCRLLTTRLREGEGFSGKRPVGDSGWDYDF